jgi:outer membrane protein assembly factor BamB
VTGTALALALALGANYDPAGLSPRLPPAPLALYSIAWHRDLVPAGVAGPALEEGGVAVDPDTGIAVCGTRDGWLHAFASDGSLAWEFHAGSGFPGAPTVVRGTVYAGSSDGRVYALALADGSRRWAYDAQEELGTPPAVAGDTVYVMSLQGTLFALDAATGAWKWHHRREARGIDRGFSIRGAAPPLVKDGTVYAGFADGFVVALEGVNGQVRWSRAVAAAGDYVDVDGLSLDGGRLYAAAYSGEVVALDPSSGAQIWSQRVPLASRVVAGKGIVVAVAARKVVAFVPEDGQPLWDVPLSGAPGATPELTDRWVLVPAQEGGLRFVERASGRTLRTLNGGTGFTARPGVHGRRVYALSNGGHLYALDLR